MGRHPADRQRDAPHHERLESDGHGRFVIADRPRGGLQIEIREDARRAASPGPPLVIASCWRASRSARSMSSTTASPRCCASLSGLAFSLSTPCWRVSAWLAAWLSNSAIIRWSSSSAPPRRCRYCWANSGNCSPTRLNNRPIATAKRRTSTAAPCRNRRQRPNAPRGFNATAPPRRCQGPEDNRLRECRAWRRAS